MNVWNGLETSLESFYSFKSKIMKDYNHSLSNVAGYGFILALIGSFFILVYHIVDYFIPKQEPVYKYCYFLTKEGPPINGYASDNREGVRGIVRFFDSIHSTTYTPDRIGFELKLGKKVEILKYYRNDSSEVKIKAIIPNMMKGGGDGDFVGYVPKFLLHDSLCQGCPIDSIKNGPN